MKTGNILVGEKDGYEVLFNATLQSYSVFKDGKFLIGNKYRLREVRTYLS